MAEKFTPRNVAERTGRSVPGGRLVRPKVQSEPQPPTTEPEKFPTLDKETYKLQLDGASIEDVKKAVHGKRFQGRDGRIVRPTGEYLELGGKQSFKIDEEGPGDTVTVGRMDVQELAEDFIEIDEHDQAVVQHESQPNLTLDDLDSAIEKKRATGEDTPEMTKILAEALHEKRSRLAEQTYKRINSPVGFNMLRLPKAKEELEGAQAEYDESLRTYGQWMVAGLESDEPKQKEMTAALAVSEMINLRAFIDSQLPPAEKSVHGGKKRRMTLGRAATAVAGGGIGLGVRLATGAMVAPVVASAIAGGVAGGVMGGVRAHKDTKSGLSEASDTEKTDLEKHVTTKNLDEVLRSHLSAEVEKATKERWIKIGKRALKGAGVGAAIGLAGATVGVAVGAGIDYLANGDVVHAQGAAGLIEPSPEPGDVPGRDSAGSESTGDEVLQETPEETTPLTTEELLQEHASDTTEAATTIESGEGAYQTFQELGIPKDQWSELLHDSDLMDKLIANGDAYEMGQDGFGLSHEGTLSDASIHDIYEAANIDTTNTVEAVATEVDAPIHDDLPDSYGELPENIQEFAHNHSVVTDIPNGMGGEQLLNKLGVDSSEWYKFEDKLLATAPDDFYRMPDGHVGLKHPGALTANGLNAIATEISKQGYALAA